MVIFPTILNYATDLSSSQDLGRNMGLYSAGVNVGLIVTPQLVFITADHWGVRSPWLLVAGAVTLSLISLTRMHVREHRLLADAAPLRVGAIATEKTGPPIAW